MTPRHHRDSARDTVFGVGIILVLFAGAATLPVFGLVGVFLLPLPVLVYRLKLGRSGGAAVPLIAFAAIAVILGGGSLDLFLFMELLMLGFVLGESFERNFSLEKTMLAACGGVSLAGLLVLLVYSHAVGVGMPDLISGYVHKNLALYEKALNQMGGAADTKQALSASIELVGYWMVRVLPGLALSGILFTAWITLLLAKPVLKHAGLACPDYGRLIRWRAPEMLVWVLIGCGVLLLVPSGAMKLVGLNGLMVVLQVYFFQGIAIISFFFEKKRIPAVVRWLLYTLLTLQVFLLVLVTGLGLFDMWLNVRKLGAEKPPAPE